MKWLLALVVIAGCGDDEEKTLTAEKLRDPAACMKCHPDHYKEWSGSMHAYASDDPVFLAMNARGQRETGGMLGEFCVKCHAPLAVAMGATTNGMNLGQLPQDLHGVTCYFCHTVDAVNDTHNNPLHLEPSSVTMRGEYGDAIKNGVHKSLKSTLHDNLFADSASLCGSCHDIVTPHGAAIERTFQEWQGSVFSHLTGLTCNGCHMNTTPNTTIADFPGVRGGRTRYSHMWPAVDEALIPNFPETGAQTQAIHDFLHTELSSALCVADYQDGTAAIRVMLDNLAAGHGFPSGSAQDRRMWVEVIAYDASNNILYKSGVVPDGTSPTTLTSMQDPDLWLLRDCMLDAQNQPVSMFWNAFSVENATPPQAFLLPAQVTNMAILPGGGINEPFYYSHIIQYYPHDKTMHPIPMPDHVTMRARLQPIGLDVIDDLLSTCTPDGTCDDLMAVRAAMPVYDVDLDQDPTAQQANILTWTRNTATPGPFDDPDAQTGPNTCVSKSAFNFVSKTYPATRHTMCSP